MPERSCATCTGAQKREWGCDAKQDENGVWSNRSLVPVVLDGVDTWRGPRRPVKDDPKFYGELMALYSAYREGVLADEGSLMSQAVLYLALMRIVHAAASECESERTKSDR